MKKFAKAFVIAALVLLIFVITACGEAKLENWPEDKFVKNVPAAQTGVVEKSMVSSDTAGNKYAMILISDFTADDMSDYIRYILDKGWETCSAQKNTNGIITYSARSKDREKTMHLVCDTLENKLSIEIE